MMTIISKNKDTLSFLPKDIWIKILSYLNPEYIFGVIPKLTWESLRFIDALFLSYHVNMTFEYNMDSKMKEVYSKYQILTFVGNNLTTKKETDNYQQILNLLECLQSQKIHKYGPSYIKLIPNIYSQQLHLIYNINLEALAESSSNYSTQEVYYWETEYDYWKSFIFLKYFFSDEILIPLFELAFLTSGEALAVFNLSLPLILSHSHETFEFQIIL
jgi:hypothetical protein